MREDELSSELRKLGLTSYEAKCYVFLVKLGPSDPRKVAAKASIPYPSAYEALKRLAQLGWVELVTRRPAVYRARDPGTILGETESRLRETFAALQAMYEATPAEQAELVYTLRGKDRVLSKLVEMIRGARASMMLVTPTETLERSETLLAEIKGAAARGVEVRVMTDGTKPEGLPPEVQVRRGAIAAFDLLVDDSRALIGLPDLSAAGWVESSAVAAHFMQFLELLWGTGSS
ncbi:MAG: TrmB family transcriptional regulator [Nitrososphaerota archaeon]|nr:TrmB family transcriptional regulator [Nitrososphaerota archaeon]MDG6966482.1 TrmB family transcriptional regulator [Nitrososphaerota archaeon]MDG6978659.1 TrmB family transcriptional regulator [Nitrososphaerota archaeon]